MDAKWTRESRSIGGIPDTSYVLLRDGEKVAHAFRSGSRLDTARWRWYGTNGSSGQTGTLDSAKTEAEKATE